MPLTAGEIIDDALAIAAPVVDTEQVPNGSLASVLTTLDQDVVRHVSMQNPEMLSLAGASIAIDSSLNLTGYPLSAALSYHSFTYVLDEGQTVPISLVPESRFRYTERHPAGVIRASGASAAFFPADPLGHSWATSGDRVFFTNASHSINYRYIALPAKITSLADTLASPDEAREWLYWSLIDYIYEVGAAPMEYRQRARERKLIARQTFLLSMAKRQRLSSGYGEPVSANQ